MTTIFTPKIRQETYLSSYQSNPFGFVFLSTLIIELESCARCLSPRMALWNFLKIFLVDDFAWGVFNGILKESIQGG